MTDEEKEAVVISENEGYALHDFTEVVNHLFYSRKLNVKEIERGFSLSIDGLRAKVHEQRKRIW